jgi:hypothetical protein
MLIDRLSGRSSHGSYLFEALGPDALVSGPSSSAGLWACWSSERSPVVPGEEL